MPPTVSLDAPYVRSDADPLRSVLLVAPSPGIARVRPSQGESSAIADRAAEQFDLFAGRLSSAGVAVVRVDATFVDSCGSSPADAAVMFSDGAFLARPSDVRRRGDVASVERELTARGVPIVGRIDAPGLFDAGDAIVAGDVLFVGVPKVRSEEVGIAHFVHGNELGRAQLAAYARSKDMRVVAVAMAGSVSRLRAVVSLVDDRTVLLASGSVDASAFDGFERIDAPLGEAYGAGVLVVGKRRVLTNLRFRETIPLLRKAKIGVDAIDVWEFGKIGVTPSILGLALKRG